MRTAILLLICCALFVTQRISAQVIDWLHHYGEPGGLRVSGGFRLAADGEGHVFAAGEFFGSDFDLGGVQFVSDDDDWALLKYDAAGNLLWARHILSTCWYSDRFAALCQAGLFSTALDTKNHTSIIRIIVIRSTAPPLAQNRCYKLAFCLSRL